MGHILLRRQVQFSATEVWPLLRDFKNIHNILPLIGSVDMVTEHDCGMGAERVCHMRGGFDAYERVVEWKEGSSYTIDIHKTSMPLMRRSLTTLTVTPVSSATCEVSFESKYEAKYGAFGEIMLLLMRPMMNLMLGGIFGGIERRLRATRRAIPSDVRAS